MAVTGLGHFNLRARDPLLSRLRDFYADVVGLRVGPRPPFRVFGYWLYAGSEPVLHLAEGGVDAAPPPDTPATLSHVALACTDEAAHVRLLEAAGVPFQRRTVPETGTPQLFFTDPAGNGVELIFPPVR